MKRILKKLIPKSLKDYIIRKRIVFQYKKYAAYDKKLYLNHSGILTRDTEPKLIGKIIQDYHVIEKGLTMPEMKLGFGRSRLINLIDLCFIYKTKYDNNNTQFLYAVGVISEYERVHKKMHFTLDKELQNRIDQLLNKTRHFPQVEQIITSEDKYFQFQHAPFNKFSNSRHSVRNFSGEVELSKIYEAVELAQNSPSACNRQPSRIHIVKKKEIIKRIFEIQDGNRGFGHSVDKLIIVSADLSGYQNAEERNCGYVDGGIYAMNLLYALHFIGIATCPLNWCTIPSDDLELRNLVEIPESQIIILIIACGNISGEFKLANSKRNDHKEIVTLH